MPKKKLTASLKAKLKKDYRRVKLSDYSGEALTYLKKVRGAAKGRKAAKDKKARIGNLVIPKDSELYQLLEKAAALKKMSVAALIKKHKGAIAAYMQSGDIMLDRETDKLIADIKNRPRGASIFVNDGNGYVKRSANSAIYNLQAFRQWIASNTSIFMLFFRTRFKLNGDIYFYTPDEQEYAELTGKRQEIIIEWLDGYDPHIWYLISPKNNEKKKRYKRISVAGVSTKVPRKEKKGKKASNANHGRKRK